jgi:hypothetical protein
MKTQQQIEREEQQRIKSLVLNYDLREGEDQDGDLALTPITPNMNIHRNQLGIEKLASSHARPDKSSNNRSGQRARRLQLSDVDWYDRHSQNKAQSSGVSSVSHTTSRARHFPKSVRAQEQYMLEIQKVTASTQSTNGNRSALRDSTAEQAQK